MKRKFLQQLTEEIIKLAKDEREAYAEEHGVRKNGFYERSFLGQVKAALKLAYRVCLRLNEKFSKGRLRGWVGELTGRS